MKPQSFLNPDKVDAIIKLSIAITFCYTVAAMVTLSMYSLVFGVNPMNGIAPADKQFFFLLSDMSKYILGSLGTLLAIKGKEKIDEWKNNNDNDNKQVVEQTVIVDPTPEDTKSPEDVKPV